MNALRLSLLSMLVAIAAGCAGTMSARMKLAPEAGAVTPDPANATIVFLRPGGGGANAILAEDGQALGEPAKGTKLVVTVPPGHRAFFKGMYMDAGGGNYTLFGPNVCNLVEGDLEAGKIYAVEASLYRLFALRPDDQRLAAWAALPTVRMTGTASVANDPTFQMCMGMARQADVKNNDGKSKLTAAHAMERLP